MADSSRTRNSFINMLASAMANIVSVLLGIIARRYFVLILGDEMQGLNGLYTNVISMLSVVELGMGSAIIYNLYKPIEQDDKETIRSLMAFYRKGYHIIGLVVAAIGLRIIPILPFFIKEVTVDINTTIIYLFFLADAVFSYFLSYKRSIFYAKQENYIVQIIHIVCMTVMKIVQTVILYITRNYYIYLAVMVMLRVVENVIITYQVSHKYPDLSDRGAKPVSEEIKQDIFLKIRGLFFHQIGAFVVNGTDNLVITKFLGLVMAGLYSNYALIIEAIRSLSKQIIEAVTPSIGNLLVTADKDKQFDVFNKLRFINFWMAAFCGICLYVLMEPWVIIWIGESRVLPDYVMLVLAFNYFQKTMRNVYLSFKTAAGIFHEDRMVPVMEAIVNITISVILAKMIGLIGVFVGTTLSGLVLWCYSYPKFVYTGMFGRYIKDYIKETLSYIAIFFGLLVVTSLVASLVRFDNAYLNLLGKLIVCLTVPNVIIIVLFHKTDNFRYCLSTADRLVYRIIKIHLFSKAN